ncbi:MAG: GNAT family N-acetyltransferase [Spirochaetales bacterium]|nr:GNAT family N-acetyltransferase [Spirochaetales bacterium]
MRSCGNSKNNQTDIGPEIVLRDTPIEMDRETIRSLARGSGVFREDEVAIAVELLDEWLVKGHASGYHFLFSEISGRVNGFTIYGPVPFTKNRYDLYWIVVDKALQGRKIGTILIRETEAKIRGMGGERIYIETSSTAPYEPTRCFYRNKGYKEDAVLKDFYRDGDSKVIFVKVL